MTRLFLLLGWLVGGALWSPSAGLAGVTRSLSTEFVEVLVEGVPLASRYVLEGKAVEVRNQSDLPMRIRYDAEVPMPDEMRAGYEPIPDAAWIGFEPRVFDLQPGETATGHAVIYLPTDPKLIGRRFQVMLLLHGDPTAGSILSIGLKPRLMFSVQDPATATGRPQVVNIPRPLAWVKPYTVTGGEPRIVVTTDSLTAENHWEEEMTYEVVPDPDAMRHVTIRPEETVLPDGAWIEVLPQTLVLPRYAKANLAVTVRLPIEARHFGRIYAGAIRTVARRKGQPPVNSYNKIRIVVPPLVPGADLRATQP